MSKPLRGIMFDNTSNDLSNNLGLGTGALTSIDGGANNVAIGYNALQKATLGCANVAIGNLAAADSNYCNTITINATGGSLEPAGNSGCFVAPIRNASATNALYYDNTTNEITWDASGGGGGGGGNLVSGNLLVTGTAEAKGLLLPPVQSAEGNSNSVITDLDPSTNPLMTKGMLWMNKAKEEGTGSEWVNQASLDISRGFFQAAALDGKIYTVGGWGNWMGAYGTSSASSSNVVSVYNPITNNWGRAAPIDISRQMMALATLDGKLYAVGGGNGDPTGDYGSSAVASGQVYDRGTIPEGTWASGTSMPSARCCAGAAVLGERLYMVGGSDTTTVFALATAEFYDPSSDTWTPTANMNTGRQSPGVAATDGKLYVMGGYGGGGQLTPLLSAEVYDHSSDTWTPIASMATGRGALSAASLGGKIYAVGGWDTLILAVGEVYNPPLAWGGSSTNPSGEWSAIAPMSIARQTFGFAAAGGKLYAVGGIAPVGGSSLTSAVEEYDPITNSWTSLAHLHSPRYAPLAVLYGKLYVIGGQMVGGIGGAGSTKTVEVYDLTQRDKGWTIMDAQTIGYRLQGAVAALGKTIYVCGNTIVPGGANTDAVETYTPPLDILKFGGFASMNTRRFQQWGAVLMGKLYVGGGRELNFQGNTVSPSTTEVYDPITDVWTEAAPLPAIGEPTSGYYGSTAVSLGGKLYVIGGSAAGTGWTGDLHAYDPSENTWTQRASAPVQNLSQFGAAALFGKIYAMTQYDAGDGERRRVQVYEPSTNSWTWAADTLNIWYASSCAALLGKLYVVGSNTVGSGGTGTPSNKAEVYDPPIAWGGGSTDPSGTWSEIANLNTARMLGGNQVTTLGGKLYVVGGQVLGQVYTNTIEVYDPLTPGAGWQTLSVHVPHYPFQSVAVGLLGSIYSVGGLPNVGGQPWSTDIPPSSKSITVADPHWEPIADMSTRRQRAAAAGMGGRLYVAGGQYDPGGFQGITSVEVYNPSDNTWETAAPMDISRCGHGLVSFGGKLYAVGAYLDYANYPVAGATVGVYDPPEAWGGRSTDPSGTWNSNSAMMNYGRYGLYLGVVGDKMYAAGSASWLLPAPYDKFLSSMEMYDFATNTWTISEEMPPAPPANPTLPGRGGGGAAVVGGTLYAAGGFGGGLNNIASMISYTPPESLETFSSLPTAPWVAWHPWSTATMGKVYVGGGRGNNYTYNNKMAVYDVSSELWTPFNSQTNAGRQGACAEALGSKIYLFGGYIEDTAGGSGGIDVRTSAICCDYTTSPFTWTPIASMDASHGYFGSAVLGGKIYAIGSLAAQDDCGGCRAVEVYDPSADTWTYVAPMDVSRGQMNCATLLGKIYAPGGGWNPVGPTNVAHASVEVYDPATGTWSYIAPLSAPRWGAQTLAVRGKLYVVGGADVTYTNSAATEVYDPMNPNQGWTTLSHTLGLNSPGGATSMGNIYLIGGAPTPIDQAAFSDATYVSVFSDESKWNYVAPMDISRSMLGLAALGGKLYAVGGMNADIQGLNSAEVYDPVENSWNPIASMNDTRNYVSAAALGGKLYAVGGKNEDAGAATNSAEVYDPMNPSEGWNYIASMGVERQQFGLAALGGKLYAVGGQDAGSTVFYQTVEVYDPIDNSWNYVASMNVPRSRLGVAALGGKIYAVGGDYNGSMGGMPKTVEVYDPIDNSWNYVASMNTERLNLGVAALGGKLYAAGDLLGAARAGKTVEVYDPIDNSWNYVASMDVSRQQFGLAALGGKLYAVGGFQPSAPSASVEAYTPPVSMTPQITYQGEDFYLNASRGGPKTFVIPHPEHEGKMLRHACLEAPTRGTNVYTCQFEATESNQTTIMPLPSYFQHINGRARVYVYPKNVLSTCYGNVNDDLTAALITTEKPGTFNVMVTGVRKDPDAVAYSATECIDEPIAVEDIH